MSYRLAPVLLTALLAGCSSPSGGTDAGEDDARVVEDVEREIPDIGAEDTTEETEDGSEDEPSTDGEDGDSDVPDGSGDVPDSDVDAEVGEQPVITDVFPTVTLSDAFIYVGGQYLGSESGDLEGISADVSVFTADGEARVELEVISAVESSMILRTPQDFAEVVGGALGLLEIRNSRGSARWLPLYATDDTTFSGKTRLGEGLRGNVYRLIENAPVLPDRDDACNDPFVRSDDGIACPFTSVVSDDLQIDPVDWEEGFPGLSADLREWFAIQFEGQIVIPESGVWSFEICSDDGSMMYLENEGALVEIINNDGQHQFICQRGDVALPAGRRGIRVDFFQGPRTRLGLSLRWRGPNDTEYVEVPETALRLFDVDP